MKKEVFLGVDQGSSSTKGVLLDRAGSELESFVAPAPEVRRDGVKVEQDPAALLASVREVINRGVLRAEGAGCALKAIGLATQRSGVLAWRAKSGEVLHPMITWADTRFQKVIDSFGPGAELITNQTGLPTIANFAAPKIHHLQRLFLEPSAYVATLDCYIAHALSNGAVYAIEETMAARTMLYSLSERGWSDELCRRFEVDRVRLPKIARSFSQHLILDGVPLMAMLGDQQAALIGSLDQKVSVVLNLGTIASLCISTGQTIARSPAMKTSVLYSRLGGERQYMIETTSPITGSLLLEPLRRNWCSGTDSLSALCYEAYQANPQGLATAYWFNHEHTSQRWPNGIPNITACRAGAEIRDRARAVVENVGNLIVRMIEECAQKGLLGELSPARIAVTGGGSEVDYLLQYVADVSGQTMIKLQAREASARGAALAAIASSYPNLDLMTLNDSSAAREYRCENPERRNRYLMWLKMERDALQGTLPASVEIEAR